MSIVSRIKDLNKELPQSVKLVAVSKFKPSSDILEAYSAGQRAFGESRPQELAAKAAELPKDIEWHFIGHLQTNKVRSVVETASLIQSVDSEHLLRAIDKAAESLGRTACCLLEIHISSESTKQGFSFDEARDIVSRSGDYPHVRLLGVMGMATFTSDSGQIQREFKSLRKFCESVDLQGFNQISMGMSDDYPIALEEGTTIVRIGTSIFGSRI